MITLTDYQVKRLADHFSKMTAEDLYKIKYDDAGNLRYHWTHGINKNNFLTFEDPAYETVFRLRFAEVLTAQRPLPHIVIEPTFTPKIK